MNIALVVCALIVVEMVVKAIVTGLVAATVQEDALPVVTVAQEDALEAAVTAMDIVRVLVLDVQEVVAMDAMDAMVVVVADVSVGAPQRVPPAAHLCAPTIAATTAQVLQDFNNFLTL